MTMVLSLGSLVGATVVGIAGGLLGELGDKLTRILVGAYVYVIRGIPILVHMFLVFFGLPAFGIRLGPYLVAVIAIAVYVGALVTEVVRGAISSLPQGQAEAAQALGMEEWQVIRLVVLPQAARAAFAPYISMIPITIKATAFASVIGIWELTLASKEVTALTLEPFAIFGVAFVIYLGLCYPLTVLATRLEHRMTQYAI